jgi:PAS domain S-box-containing protein
MTSILVLDDRAENRELMLTVLRHAGYAVTDAATGAEALERIGAAPPDLIIADILMPGMDGYEFVRRLRSDPLTRGIRVMFCTATYAEDEIRTLAAACGVSQILFKPCEPGDIYAAVSAALAATEEAVAPLAPEDFHGHLHLLNRKLVDKIAELEDAERRGAETLMLLETLQATAPVGFGFVDRDFRVIRINGALAEVSGIPADQQIGRTTQELVPDLWPQIEPLYRHILETGEPILNLETEGVALSTRLGGYWLSSFFPVLRGPEVMGIGLVVVDITERRQAESLRAVVMDNMLEGVMVGDAKGQLLYMNAAASALLGWREDELQGRPMHAAIHHQHADGSPFPVEECALSAMQAEGREVRETDDAFIRKDGTIIPVAYSGAPLRTGDAISGSVVVFRDITDEKAEQLRAERELDALTWVGRIRDALEEDRLVLHTQPIIALNGGRDSEELLIRMRARTGELVSPGAFLPAAERYGLIGEIDRWVIGQALGLAADGRHIEANLSARSLGDLSLLRFIEAEVRTSGVDPALLVFEITETALMQNLEAGEAFVRGLVELGFGIALDDFGTGFASFTYLKRLPIRFLKIDVEFIRDLVTDPSNQFLVRATVGLARDFGYQTIAEGVEDSETLALVRELGVDFAQGYHLGRPAPLQQPAA